MLPTVSLRWRVILLVLLAAIPALALTIYSAREQRHRAAWDAAQEALRTARLGSSTQERLAEGARQLLIALAQLPEVRGVDAKACSNLLRLLKGQYELRRDGRVEQLYANLGVVEVDGTVFASALPVEERVNIADRPYFRRAMGARDFAVGDFQIGRITGRATVNFAYPVFDGEGNIIRLVFAAIDLEWIRRLVDEAQLPAGAELTLVDRNGTILVRHPQPPGMQWAGRSILDIPLGRRMIAATRGESMETEGLDGVRRLYAYLPLGASRHPEFAYLSVGLPLGMAYAEADRMERRNLILLGVVTSLAMLAAWVGGDLFVLRRVRALVRATTQLAQGDLSARTGLAYGTDELGQLASRFDQMAATLEERTAERRRAQEQLRKLNEELEGRVAGRTRELQDKNEQMEDEIKLAREIQLAILPHSYPAFPSHAGPDESALRFYHRYIPTGAVGGDFFIVLPLSDHEAGLFLCDVMGHGPRSALVTAMVRGLMEELAPSAKDPGLLMTRLNHEFKTILRETGSPIFATAFYLVADAAAGTMRFVRAGHPSPLHIRRKVRAVEPIACPPGRRGPALGLFDAFNYLSSEKPLAEGDLIMLFTDGILEVVNAGGEEFSEEALRRLVEENIRLSAPALFDELLAQIRSFAGSEQFEDDICLLGMEVARILGTPEAEAPLEMLV